jgi:hypothetical protein
MISGRSEQSPPAETAQKRLVNQRTNHGGEMEYIIVRFPTDRFVYIDGEKGGKTNEKLRVEAGTHEFDLGSQKNYEPELQEVVVEGTTVLQPMEIVFSRKDR